MASRCPPANSIATSTEAPSTARISFRSWRGGRCTERHGSDGRSPAMSREAFPASIEATRERLLAEDYVADRQLATAVFLALKLERPLFLEGQPGTGKTEIAKVLAGALAA